MVGHGGTAVRVVACGLAWRARDVTGMRRKLRGGWPRGWPRDHGRRQDALPPSHEQGGETDVGRCMMTVSGTRTERMDPVDVAWLHMDRPTNLMVVNTVLWFDVPVD